MIGNDPMQEIPFQLKQRRPFALQFKLEKKGPEPVNLTGSALRMVIAQQKKNGGTVVLERMATLTSPTLGLARFLVQGAELDIDARSYDMTITLIDSSDFESSLVEGPIVVTRNPDPTVPEDVADVASPVGLTARLLEGNRVTVRVDHAPDSVLLAIRDAALDAASEAGIAADLAAGYADTAGEDAAATAVAAAEAAAASATAAAASAAAIAAIEGFEGDVTAAEASAAAAAASAVSAATSASTAAGSSSTANAARVSAQGWATFANEAMDNAQGFEAQALTHAQSAHDFSELAEAHRDSALAYRNTTMGYRNEAAGYADDAQGHAADSATSAAYSVDAATDVYNMLDDIVVSTTLHEMVVLTAAAYAALGTKVATTLYVIVG